MITDAELVVLSVMQALLGFTSQAQWLHNDRGQFGYLFPYLPKQPGYNKVASPVLSPVTAWC